MGNKYKKIYRNRKYSKTDDSGVRITPVFRTPIDIKKLGHAFLMLAEEKPIFESAKERNNPKRSATS